MNCDNDQMWYCYEDYLKYKNKWLKPIVINVDKF